MNIDLPGEAYLPASGMCPTCGRRSISIAGWPGSRPKRRSDDFAAELVDRFGPLPEVVEHLLELARLRIWAHGWGVREIRLEDRYAVLGYSSRDKLARLVKRSDGRLRVADAAERVSAAGLRA